MHEKTAPWTPSPAGPCARGLPAERVINREAEKGCVLRLVNSGSHPAAKGECRRGTTSSATRGKCLPQPPRSGLSASQGRLVYRPSGKYRLDAAPAQRDRLYLRFEMRDVGTESVDEDAGGVPRDRNGSDEGLS